MKKYMAERKKDPKFREEFLRKQKAQYEKRKAEYKKNPELYEKAKKENRERQKKRREEIRKDPKKNEEFLKKQRVWGRNALARMTPEQKFEMGKRSRVKYRSTEKGILKRKEYKQSEKSKAHDREYSKIYRSDPINQEKIKKWHEENREKNRPKRNEYMRTKRKTDILFRLVSSMRSRMNLYIKRSRFNKKKRTFKMIGCSPEELRKHLEKQFRPGMSWANHGSWHIDHIIPLDSAKNEEEMNKLFHYSNLQPLWATENLKKSNKY